MRVLRMSAAFLLVIAFGVSAEAQQEREPRGQQERQLEQSRAASSSSPETERLWDQISLLHNRIVEIEVRQHDPQRGAAGSAAPESRISQPQTGQAAGSARGPSEDRELWMRLAQIHKQLVAAQLSETGPATSTRSQLQGDAPAQRGRSETERGVTEDNENAQRQDTTRLGQASGTNRGMPEQLWEQYTAVQKQILEQAVRRAKASPQERRAELSTRPESTRERDNREREERDR